MFKLTVFIFAFLPLAILASDELCLSDVPWTDSRPFWTWEGKRLPVKDKNLFGHEISIGGEKFKRGLAGHTGFTIVYNLSQKALRFTAMVGIDDEAHKKDPKNITESSVNVVILVDRKEVFRQKVELGKKAVPVDIDLKGKYQLEIRGEYDTGFHKQRIVFADPKLEVKSKDSFMKSAQEWKDKVESATRFAPEYPAAPDWKNIKISTCKFAGSEKAYRINNGKIELVILPEFGGRLVSLNLRGQKNIIYETARSASGKGKIDHNEDGHFCRPQPSNYFTSDYDPVLLTGRYSIEFPEEGKVVLTSAPSWNLFLRYQYAFKVETDKPEVELTTVHRCIAPFVNKAGIWSITRLDSRTLEAIRIPTEAADAPKKYRFSPEKYANLIKRVDGWDSLEFAPGFIESLGQRDSIQWEQFSSKNEEEAVTNQCTFRKSFDVSRKDWARMEGFFPAHFYVSKKFLEVEAHGPIVNLNFKEEISLREKWTLSSKGN
ncbi:MAG: hypothetical protein A2020_15130 [Lentisphaerae bacterium GWF2_45_14]|nr:MAG: hypothetical protein A2020_15130 [Lentisphaerae bacterium GWF2_45_14]